MIELTPPVGQVYSNKTFTDNVLIADAQYVVFRDCTFTGTMTPDQAQLKFLGGVGWSVINCKFSGGVQAGQLSIGLNWRKSGLDAVPQAWTVEGCTFDAPTGQWQTYPQTHHIYNNTDPTYAQNGLIEDCTFTGHPYGYCIKIGGTGSDPLGEGARGVLVKNCHLNGVSNGDRAATILLEGKRSEATFQDCTLTATDSAPYIQAVNGARLRMINTSTPDGVVEYSTWYYWYFFTRSAKSVAPPNTKPANIGGISWV